MRHLPVISLPDVITINICCWDADMYICNIFLLVVEEIVSGGALGFAMAGKKIWRISKKLPASLRTNTHGLCIRVKDIQNCLWSTTVVLVSRPSGRVVWGAGEERNLQCKVRLWPCKGLRRVRVRIPAQAIFLRRYYAIGNILLTKPVDPDFFRRR